jgi:hypothetical protein
LFDSIHSIAVAKGRPMTSVVEQLLQHVLTEHLPTGTPTVPDRPDPAHWSDATCAS